MTIEELIEGERLGLQRERLAEERLYLERMNLANTIELESYTHKIPQLHELRDLDALKSLIASIASTVPAEERKGGINED